MGSYYCPGRKTKKKGVVWRLMYQSYKNGERSQDPVGEREFTRLGFKQDMTPEEARRQAKIINAENRLKNSKDRKVEDALQAAARNARRIKKEKSVFLPSEEHADFIVNYLAKRRFGSEENRKRIFSHWNRAQKIITFLRMLPKDFEPRCDEIYDHMIDSAISVDYAMKLRRVINLWGQFYSRLHNSYFKPLPPPDSFVRNQIQEAYEESDNFRGASALLTEEIFNNVLKPKFEAEGLSKQSNFLALTLYLGLRPSECDWLKKRQFTFAFDETLGVDVLHVYQAKLVRLKKADRWKFIPLFLPQQKVLKTVILNLDFERPLTKTVKSYSRNRKLTLYGGRKYFCDLMLKYSQRLEDISGWMGHSTVNQTWRTYRNKNRVAFNPIEIKIQSVAEPTSDQRKAANE